jgi:hypothetical protein
VNPGVIVGILHRISLIIEDELDRRATASPCAIL